MALPVIPLLIVAGLALLGRKPKRPEPTPTPTPTGQEFNFDLDGLKETPEIAVRVGDKIHIQLPIQVALPAAWQIFTEAVEGEPVVVVTQEDVGLQQPLPGLSGFRLFHLEPQAPGTVNVSVSNLTADNQSLDSAATVLKIAAAGMGARHGLGFHRGRPHYVATGRGRSLIRT
jgi:hypothetical protein